MISTQFDRIAKPLSPVRLGVASTVLAVLLVGCGESKVAQCNKLITVVNKGQQISQSIKGMDAPAMKKLSTDLGGLSKEISAVEVADEKLKGFQGRFVKIYDDLSSASSKVGSALEEIEKNKKPTPETLKKLKQLQSDVAAASKTSEAAAASEKGLVQEVNTYCSAK
jgi:DNA repair ATPase RecN